MRRQGDHGVDQVQREVNRLAPAQSRMNEPSGGHSPLSRTPHGKTVHSAASAACPADTLDIDDRENAVALLLGERLHPRLAAEEPRLLAVEEDQPHVVAQGRASQFAHGRHDGPDAEASSPAPGLAGTVS